jgi:hypothetical protein
MLKLTTVRRALALAVAATLGACAAVAFSMPATGGAATATTYSFTVAGTDMVSLNPRVVPLYVGGGGVQATNGSSAALTGPDYFEAHLDLPVGARVTSIAITYAGALDGVGSNGTFTFGSYAPAFAAGAQYFTIPVDRAATTKPKTATRTGNPITAVNSGKRYVIDWAYDGVSPGQTSATYRFYGATVKYTCTAPCVP